MLLVGVGVLGVLGVRMMSQSQDGDVTTRVVSAPTESGGAALDTGQEAAIDASGAADATKSGVAIAAGPNFVVFQGAAFRLIGPSTLEKDQLRRVGVTQTQLDGNTSRGRDVYEAEGVTGLFLDDDQGQLLEFQPLQRVFAGRTYELQSAAITRFGVWPSLPAGISAPTSTDGSPTFVAAGADDTGVTIYRKTSSTAAEGIALPPNPPSPDPATGQPSWTWWAPVQ